MIHRLLIPLCTYSTSQAPLLVFYEGCLLLRSYLKGDIGRPKITLVEIVKNSTLIEEVIERMILDRIEQQWKIHAADQIHSWPKFLGLRLCCYFDMVCILCLFAFLNYWCIQWQERLFATSNTRIAGWYKWLPSIKIISKWLWTWYAW